jgi:predicted amino acid dehydrogenase
MEQHERSILMIEFIREEVPREFDLQSGGLSFHIHSYCIGWDFATAASLVKSFDGQVDAIVLAGLRDVATYGNSSVPILPPSEVVAAAQKTPVYLGAEMERMFASWILNKAQKKYPEVFRGRKALLHTALLTPFASLLESYGMRVSSADPLLLLNRGRALRGPTQIRTFLKFLAPSLASKNLVNNNTLYKACSRRSRRTLANWISEADIFVTYARFLHGWIDSKSLAGKVLIIDQLTQQQRREFTDAGVIQIIELLPELKALENLPFRCFGLLTAVMDLLRSHEDSQDSLMDYTLSFMQNKELRVVPFKPFRSIPRRCAFILHPLSTKQLLSADALSWMSRLPKSVQQMAEKAILHAPIQKVGQVRGVRSNLNGQEVICDLYALPATPKRILEMRSDLLYRRLVEAACKAQKDGSVLIGLGAYTKVAGDAGVTVARLSPIPVTTGNSYSASATVWAAYEMVVKLGFVKEQKNGKFSGTAMIVGATGAIGRVSALVLAEKFDTIVLVAPRAEKLLELKDEMEKSYPDTRVILSTRADKELPNCDLVVTATSNTRGDTLDIMQVKPGAVICDCSRPLDISVEDVMKRPDVLVIESGEIDLPGNVEVTLDIGLPKPTVYACLAETIMLTMEGRYEPFSLSRHLSASRVKEIHEIGLKHGARLAPIQSQLGIVDDARIETCRALAQTRRNELEKK